MADAGTVVSAKAAELRGELKAWEKEFETSNDGRKAGREDIKANAAIAAKYKEYNRLRNILSGKYPATPQPQSEPPRPRHNQQQQRKRKSHADIPTTPSKRLAAAANTAVTVSLPHSTPSSTKPTPTRLPQVIGPTPQKDGLVLGLFDLLPPAETPSREGARRRTALTDIEANGSNAVVAQTPRKEALQPEGGARGSRTPMSAGKRAFLDRFATPMKAGRGRGEGSRDGDRERKVHSTTPVFLRRDGVGLELVEEEDVDGRARRRPFGRKGLVRSLSSMIQRARQQEEERLDEELDILREMEAEVAGSGPAKRDVPKILIQDSQALEMPLGPDGTVESEEDEQDAAATDKARKLWKKRGQKRQTRRFILRPVHTKPEPQPWLEDAASEDDETGTDRVGESQAPVAAPSANDQKAHGEDSNDGEAAGSCYNSDASDTSQSTKKKKTASSRAGKTGTSSKGLPSKAAKAGDGKSRKTVRKLNEQAHANYHRLKIKNKNSKANGRGRFSRNRR